MATLGIGSSTFSPTFGGKKKTKVKEFLDLAQNHQQGTRKTVDPWSEEIYDSIDDAIQKAGLKIPGSHPKGTKVLGREVEQRLYSGLQKRLWGALQSTDDHWEQSRVLKHLEDAIDAWRRRMYEGIEEADRELLRRGFIAGLQSTGETVDWDKYQNKWDILLKDPNRMEPKFQEFRKEVLKKVRDLVAGAYDADGYYEKDRLEQEVMDWLPAHRHRIELIVRTEASNMSNAGRFFAWNEDPERDFYEYRWEPFGPDGRNKFISLWRGNQNPLTFDELLFLWEHQSQDMGAPVGLQHDFYNQRCAVSRGQKGVSERKGNRWKGSSGFFPTLSLGIA